MRADLIQKDMRARAQKALDAERLQSLDLDVCVGADEVRVMFMARQRGVERQRLGWHVIVGFEFDALNHDSVRADIVDLRLRAAALDLWNRIVTAEPDEDEDAPAPRVEGPKTEVEAALVEMADSLMRSMCGSGT